MVSVDSSARAAGPDAVAIGRKRNVVKMRRVQAIGNGQPIIGNGPRTLSGKRPTAAALRLERLDRSAVPPSRDIVVRDYDAFMAERVRLAAAEAGNPGKEEAHTIAAPASTAPASPAFPPLPPAHGGLLYRYALVGSSRRAVQDESLGRAPCRIGLRADPSRTRGRPARVRKAVGQAGRSVGRCSVGPLSRDRHRRRAVPALTQAYRRIAGHTTYANVASYVVKGQAWPKASDRATTFSI